MSKHYCFDDDIVSFDKTTLQILQKINFHKNVLKFVLGCIPTFDAEIAATKNKVEETPSNPGWVFLTTVIFKTLIIHHKNILPLRHMKKRYGI